MNRNAVAAVLALGVVVGSIAVTSQGDRGLSQVTVSGLATGNGKTTSPVDVPISKASHITGAGTVGDPFSAADFYSASLGLLGDGSDGAVTLSGNTTLTRDMYYESLTINGGVVLNPAGYHVYVRRTLTMESASVIRRNGGNGGNGANKSNSIGSCNTASGCTAGATGGVLPPAASNGGSASCGSVAGAPSSSSPIAYEYGASTANNGGTGCSGAGCTGGNGTDGARGRGGGGGQGGNGGGVNACGAIGAGTTAGSLTAQATNFGSIKNLFVAISGQVWSRASRGPAFTKLGNGGAFSAGAGGGTCGCHTGSNVHSSGAAGGTGGGYIVVMAHKMVCNSCTGLEAKGGNGGNGGTGNGTANEPGAGGGGGGPGGIIVCIVGTGSCVPTNVSGGTEGLGGAGGAGGGNGGNGGVGGDGMVISYRLGPA